MSIVVNLVPTVNRFGCIGLWRLHDMHSVIAASIVFCLAELVVTMVI